MFEPNERTDRLERKVDDLAAGQRKLTVMFEAFRERFDTVADGVITTNERMEKMDARIDGRMGRIETLLQSFIDTQTHINRELSNRDADHEKRIGALEKRRRGMS